ncbi:nucleoside permease [Chryseobacterium sp. FH1]|uniref:nucleoside permease n=1 Tax=Chryseobacterium sp. FH1 TaxID=1233951 RepID=UPI0004E3B088|nr:nucleoside permease [Chryseobacterium sp. FH1]KFC23027.1 nucleoside permease [Chryseobacterium sp. FH1]
MSLKLRLTILSFLQFFVWGAWLTTLGTYGFAYKQWSGAEFGAVFSTLGIASIFMPALMGIVADKWINAEKLYGSLHILYGITLFMLAKTNDPTTFFWILLVGMCFYMPTLSLSNSISYKLLKDSKYDVVKVFPPIRVWGTIGFIVAMWVTNIFSDEQSFSEFGKNIGINIADFFGNSLNANQFYFAGIIAVLLGVFAFFLPKCPPPRLISKDATLSQKLGLDAFKLFGERKMAMFFVFSMFLGAALQLTNMYGDTFLKDFGNVEAFKNSAVVQYSTIIISISQISETLFILAIPFFLYKFGIKKVMLISMIAWVLRFGFFSFGAPEGFGLVLIILSNIIYGMAFDFFNISGSLFVETTTDSKIRSSAQGVFMMMTNGFGAILGSSISGWLITNYFTSSIGEKMWSDIWFYFAAYALVIAILFGLFFRHKHSVADVEKITH